MAVTIDGEKKFEGAVIYIWEHHYADGMADLFAHCWDVEKQEFTDIQYGYVGIDGYNFIDGSARVDLTEEVVKDIIRALKKNAAIAYGCETVEYKRAIAKGRKAEVVKGKKVPVGTVLEIFWVGEKPTYKAKNSPSWSWHHGQTELIAGGHDENGNVVWIKADYLKNLTKITTPTAKMRRRWIKNYVQEQLAKENIRYAYV